MLEKIRYSERKWLIRADLKVIAILTELQLGYTKYCCFFTYGTREQEVNIMSENSGLPDWYRSPVSTTLQTWHWFHKKIIHPPLHIKLGLFKQFVKAFNKKSLMFQFLQKNSPNWSEAKIKEGVFVGPQIQKLILNTKFDEILHGNNLDA